MKLKKLVAPSLTDLFVNEMKQLIMSGELKAGEKLASERELANDSEVSLAVINAGITRLNALGFLNIVPRRGVFVSDFVRDGNLNTMIEIIEFSGDHLNPDVLLPIVEFRRGIEVGATKLTCKHRTEKNLETLRALLEEAYDSKNHKILPEACFKFHHEIAMASTNMYYPMIIRTFEPMYIIFYRALKSQQSQEAAAKHLENILGAITDQNEKEAEHVINVAIDCWQKSTGCM